MSSSQSKTVTVESIFELDFLRGKRPKEDAPKISATFLASLPLLQNSEYSGDVVLITGANKGIGYETARLLGAKGLKVLVGCRDNERGQAAEKQLREDNKSGSFHFIQLDVASEASITAAVDSISKTYGHLDVLVNNAGIMDFSSPSETSGEKLRNVFATNAFGPMLLTKACLPLLQKSSHPRVVNVSSGLGSADSHNPVNGTYLSINNSTYCCSKAALDLYTVLLANEMRTKQPALRVNVIDPGYTATDLNHHSGPQTLSEGTDAIIAASLLSSTGPTGAFFNRFGYVAW